MSNCVVMDVKTSLHSNTAEKIVALNVWSALLLLLSFAPLFIGNASICVYASVYYHMKTEEYGTT